MKFTDSGLEAYLATDEHSPGMARVKGPLQNSEEFANTFNCPVGSEMNPDRPKCDLW